MSPAARSRELALDGLLEATDAVVARGDDAFDLRDTRIALILGVVHGLRLESAYAAQRETAVALARAGYALRRAEEHFELAPAGAPLAELLLALEKERTDLPHWEAMQIVAWETADDPSLERFSDLVDVSALAGHSQRDQAMATLIRAAVETFGTGTPVGSLAEDEGLRAAWFGYALRIAERSLPEDRSRLLRDGDER